MRSRPQVTCRRRYFLAGLLLAATVFPALYLGNLRFDNRIELWVPQSSAAYAIYRDFRNRFGSDEFILVGIETSDPLSDTSLTRQRALATGFAKIPGVARVVSIPGVGDVLRENLTDWREEVRGGDLLKGLLLGKDGQSAGILIHLDPPKRSDSRRRVVAAVNRVAREVGGAEFHPYLVGPPVINATLDRMSEEASRAFLPIALALSVLVLMILFRNLVCVIVSLLPVGICIVWTMGLLALSTHGVNMVTVVLPSLLCVLVLSGAIHLTARYVAVYREDLPSEEIMRRVLDELCRPLVISALTTAAGFLALAVSGLEPVRDLGIFAAGGILIGLVCNILIVPTGLIWLYRGRHGAQSRDAAWGAWLGRWAKTANRRILWGSVLILVACVGGLIHLRFESNVLSFFKSDQPIHAAHEFVGKRLSGFYSLEVLVACPTERADEVLEQFNVLARNLKKFPAVRRVDHPGSIEAAYDNLSRVRQAKGKQLTTQAETWFEGLIGNYYKTESGQSFLRFSLMVTAMQSSDTEVLMQRVRQAAAAILPADLAWEVTGIVPLLTAAQADLVRTQIWSFGLAFGLIMVMIGVLFRSFRAVLSAILPNLLPLALTLACMGWLGISLDAATVMIASVALGIAADDTIHFLFRYRTEMRTGLSPAQAAEGTIAAIGPAVLFTSLVAAAGFGVLAFAEFLPLAWFGFLTGLTMLTALAGDVFILPAMVIWIRLWDDLGESKPHVD